MLLEVGFTELLKLGKAPFSGLQAQAGKSGQRNRSRRFAVLRDGRVLRAGTMERRAGLLAPFGH